MSLESASRKVWILASSEILAELQAGWSRPVQAHAVPNPDGSWEMTFRTAEGAERRVLAAADALRENVELDQIESDCRAFLHALFNAVDELEEVTLINVEERT